MNIADPIDLVIAVRQPLLNEFSPGNRYDIGSNGVDVKSIVYVTMMRHHDVVSMRIRPTHVWYGLDGVQKRWVHLVRMDGEDRLTVEAPLRYLEDMLFMDGNYYFQRQIWPICPEFVHFSIPSFDLNLVHTRGERLQQGSQYAFYVVISRSSELKSLFHVPKSKQMDPITEATKNMGANQASDMLLRLLRDIHLVETQFVFTSDKSYAGIGLWAHRAVLSKHLIFDYLIKQAVKDHATSSETESEFSPLTITISGVSLATFCVLLMFMYTNKIERTIDPNKFALSKPHASLVIHDTAGQIKSSFRWHPLDLNSPWHFKEVSWEELLLGAVLFGIDNLRVLCEDALKEAIA